MKKTKRFFYIQREADGLWFSHITGNEGEPVVWVKERREANQLGSQHLATTFTYLAKYGQANGVRVRRYCIVSQSDRETMMRKVEKIHALLLRMGGDEKTIASLRKELEVEKQLSKATSDANFALRDQAKKLWEALAPFGKMMRDVDRARLADPKWRGHLLAQRGFASDMTILDERDIAQAGVVWRECWMGDGEPPDDNGSPVPQAG
jgi:hypothetical protein